MTSTDVYDDITELITILDELKDEDFVTNKVPSESVRRLLRQTRFKFMRLKGKHTTGGT